MGEGPVTRNRSKRLRPFIAVGAAAVLSAGAAIGATAASASTTLASKLAAEYPGYHVPATAPASLYRDTQTTTPIKHLVVIFGENISFDHYFGTYPYTANTDGTPFYAKPGTPKVNGLYQAITSKGPVGPLLTHNPNEYNPQRLTPSEALTTDQNHGYTPEQKADDNGKQDKYVQNTESTATAASPGYGPPGIVMDYFDGNTVTAMWNYAQYYSMSDNMYDSVFGPSTPGALDVTSGTTAPGYAVNPKTGKKTTAPGTVSVLNSNGLGTVYSDIDPYYDQCSDSNHTTTSAEAVSTSPNVGNLLNAAHVTWGWFEGGFAPSAKNSGGAVCATSHELTSNGKNVASVQDYIPHHDPFQYNVTTANPAHLPPTSLTAIGRTDQASHQYDMSYFTDALNGTGGATLPAVSYLKAPGYQDAHPGYSDPLEEQTFLVNTINAIEQSKYWPSTAIIITYDDSDGWYDHVPAPVINGSHDPATDTTVCTSKPVTVGTYNDRCGYGVRMPFMVISPYTKANHVSGTRLDTASVVKFIEDNWLHGERIPGSYDATSGAITGPGGLLNFQVKPDLTPLILNPATGAVVSGYGTWNTSRKNGAHAGS